MVSAWGLLVKMSRKKFGYWQEFLDKTVQEFNSSGKIVEFEVCKTNEDRIAYIRRTKVLEPLWPVIWLWGLTSTSNSKHLLESLKGVTPPCGILSCVSKLEWNSTVMQETSWITDYFTETKRIKCERGKSLEEACSLRQDGNKQFQRKQFAKAVETYSKCIQLAPLDCPENQASELALGYANRSAALYHQGLYKQCLADITLALKHGYPDALQYKVLQRRGQCLYYKLQLHSAMTALEEAMELLDKATQLKDERKASIRNDIGVWMGKTQSKSNSSQPSVPEPMTQESQAKPIPEVCYAPNPELVHATKAIDLREDGDRGRYLVATSPIEPGDVLIVERPYAAVLLPPHYGRCCHHCFAKLLAPLPCRHCAVVRYCSEACQLTSWQSYHYLECTYLDLLHSIGIAHLGLRIILTAGLHALLTFKEEHIASGRSEQPGIAGVAESGQYQCNYLSVYELMPHTQDMHKEDQLQYALTASLLLKCLENSTFFHQEGGKPLGRNIEGESTKLFIGGLLLRHICQLVCNAHAITELAVTSDTDFSLLEMSSQVRVATAIYPTASLMNHSCDPTILSRSGDTCSFQNDMLIVRAVKQVAPGEEVFNCYGPHCKRMALLERQQCLREQYFFDCSCPACRTEDQDNKVKALRCSHCEGPLHSAAPRKCFNCGQVKDTTNQMKAALKSRDLFVQGLQQLEKRNVSGAIQYLNQCLQLRTKALYRHNKDLAETQDALARCYAISGNFNKAAELLSESVKSTEVIYGTSSIELATELQKYADVLVNSKDVEKASQVVTQAIEIFTLNLGSKCSQVEELKEFSSILRHLGQ